MFHTETKFWKTLAIAAFAALPQLAPGEGGYTDRQNRPEVLPDKSYNQEIGNNRKNNPIRAGESDTEFAVRTSHLPGSLSPVAPEDTAGSDGGSLDRAEKLSDAETLAKNGRNAAEVQAAEMIVALSNGLTSVASPDGSASQAGSLSAITEAAGKYTQIWNDMTTAQEHNRTGKIRLRYDPDGDDEAGHPEQTPSRGLTERLADKMSPEAKEVLQGRGLDPHAVLERLLSGEVDTSDPAAVLRELGDTTELSESELAEARQSASSQSIDPNRGIVEDSGHRTDSDTLHPELAGFPVSPVVRGLSENFSTGSTVRPESQPPTPNRGVKKRVKPTDFYSLRERGITTPRYGSNIFTFAHRGFRLFKRGRDTSL